MPECGWGGGSVLCAICSPCGNKSSTSVIYFMCTEICFVKSLGDWHDLEDPCKAGDSTHSEEVHIAQYLSTQNSHVENSLPQVDSSSTLFRTFKKQALRFLLE